MSEDPEALPGLVARVYGLLTARRSELVSAVCGGLDEAAYRRMVGEIAALDWAMAMVSEAYDQAMRGEEDEDDRQAAGELARWTA